MHKKLLAALFLCVAAILSPAHAQPVNGALKEAATLIPIPGIEKAVNDLFGALKPAGHGVYMAKATVPQVPGVGDIPLQLYFMGDADKQAVLLVVDKRLSLPGVFNNRAWKFLGNGTSAATPIFSLSTVEFSLNVNEMPAEFQKVIADSYFGVPAIDFASGFQTAMRADIGGPMKTVLEIGMGVPAQTFTMRAGTLLPAPTDANSRAALAVSMLSDMKNVGKTVKDLPEFFVELQLAPGKTISSPMGMSAMTLSDATFSITNTLTVGYKGNVTLSNGLKFITFFQTPLNPAGAMDLLDFTFGLAAQKITLEDYVNMGFAFSTPKLPGGNFIRDITKYQDELKQVTKPLAVFQLRNPRPVGEYRFGDKTKPFPPLNAFNILLLGPLASIDDVDGKTIQGPLLKTMGDATVLGQQMASMDVRMGISGLRAKASAGMNLKLGPLGRQGIAMATKVDINKGKQDMLLHGNVIGRTLDLNLNPYKLSIVSPATCATPFEISEKIDFKPDLDAARILDSLPGVNVDPSKLDNCIGEDLKKALNWVGSTGSQLGGYTAKAANEELARQEAAAKAEYNRIKNAARNEAQNSINDASRAMADAGNAIKRAFGGGKKKKKSKPDLRFDQSVFDWDYYYDAYADLRAAKVDFVDHWRSSGFNEGRRASLEFDVRDYLNRYPDLKRLYGDNFGAALDHWVNHGMAEGRQGSPDFDIKAYLARYPDLQRAFGATNYDAAFDHWFDHGQDEGRSGRP